MLARDLISQGEPATEVCFRCGCGSYSTFSRAYGKFFGTTPTGRTLSASAMEETFE
jgi:AraC-like DNA-binding protein